MCEEHEWASEEEALEEWRAGTLPGPAPLPPPPRDAWWLYGYEQADDGGG